MRAHAHSLLLPLPTEPVVPRAGGHPGPAIRPEDRPVVPGLHPGGAQLRQGPAPGERRRWACRMQGFDGVCASCAAEPGASIQGDETFQRPGPPRHRPPRPVSSPHRTSRW